MGMRSASYLILRNECSSTVQYALLQDFFKIFLRDFQVFQKLRAFDLARESDPEAKLILKIRQIDWSTDYVLQKADMLLL